MKITIEAYKLLRINSFNAGTGLSSAVNIHALIAAISASINPAFQPLKIQKAVAIKQ